MARKVDPAKAKAARQKKIAIGLSVMFFAVLAFQVPRTLKMLEGPPQGPAAAAAATPVATPTPSGTTPPAPGAPAVAVPAASGGVPADPAAQPAVLADTDLAPAAAEGQLLSFEQFESKDPFRQQAVAEPAQPADEAPAPDAGDFAPVAPVAQAVPAKPAATSAVGGTAVGASAGGGSAGSGSGSVVAGGGSSTGVAPAPAPAAPVAAPAVAVATSIAINGTAEDVQLKGTFPAANPTFVLVSEAADGKSVQIGIAGGAYADGRATIELELGKPLTLQNTADGSRFALELRAVKGFVPPKKK